MANGATRPRATAWTISVAAHTAIVATLMTVFGTPHRREASAPLARLVYVEPAAPPLGAPARAPFEPTAAPAVAAPAAATPETAAALSPPLRTRVRRVAPTQPVPPPAPAAGAPETLAPSADGSAAGASLGTTAGVAGGTVGGVGTVPVPLRDVAAPPELISRVLPDYPPQARAMQIEGQVVLEVVLDREGRIEDAVRVTRSIPLLDPAAITAVKRWRFRPARDRDGRPVRVIMDIPVRFVLR